MAWSWCNFSEAMPWLGGGAMAWRQCRGLVAIVALGLRGDRCHGLKAIDAVAWR